MKRSDANPIVFLLDAANTPVDHDRIEQDLRDHLEPMVWMHGGDTGSLLKNAGGKLEVGYGDFLGCNIITSKSCTIARPIAIFSAANVFQPRKLVRSAFGVGQGPEADLHS